MKQLLDQSMTRILFLLIPIFWMGFPSGIRAEDDPKAIFEKFSELYIKINPVRMNPFEEYFTSSDVKAYEDFALKHWKILLSDVDRLPSRRGNPQTVTAAQISVFCEKLPPMEYLDLLDRLIDLVAGEKINPDTLMAQINGTESKHLFIAVNFEHARVRDLLRRAKEVSGDHPNIVRSLERHESGELADGYQVTNGADFFPQTLPGIKLRHPDETLIRKYEQMTGRRIPRDPRFETQSAIRPPRRMAQGEVPGNDPGEPRSPASTMWPWIAGGATIVVACFGLWMIRRVARSR